MSVSTNGRFEIISIANFACIELMWEGGRGGKGDTITWIKLCWWGGDILVCVRVKQQYHQNVVHSSTSSHSYECGSADFDQYRSEPLTHMHHETNKAFSHILSLSYV